MKVLIRIAVIFLILSIISSVMANQFQVEFGQVNYWNVHGIWFLVLLAVFPRLTLLLSSVASGGALWWLGWLFTPRLLVAILATFAYWKTNPALVVAAWLVCWGGETGEKYVFVRQKWQDK